MWGMILSILCVGFVLGFFVGVMFIGLVVSRRDIRIDPTEHGDMPL